MELLPSPDAENLWRNVVVEDRVSHRGLHLSQAGQVVRSDRTWPVMLSEMEVVSSVGQQPDKIGEKSNESGQWDLRGA